jgi:hypothetical protein
MSAPIDGDDLQSLARQLAYGSPATRQRLVEELLSRGDVRIWTLLVDTVRSGEPWSLRARCLEVLGLAAARADQQTAELILPAPRTCGWLFLAMTRIRSSILSAR